MESSNAFEMPRVSTKTICDGTLVLDAFTSAASILNHFVFADNLASETGKKIVNDVVRAESEIGFYVNFMRAANVLQPYTQASYDANVAALNLCSKKILDALFAQCQERWDSCSLVGSKEKMDAAFACFEQHVASEFFVQHIAAEAKARHDAEGLVSFTDNILKDTRVLSGDAGSTYKEGAKVMYESELACAYVQLNVCVKNLRETEYHIDQSVSVRFRVFCDAFVKWSRANKRRVQHASRSRV